jgi:glycosidase
MKAWFTSNHDENSWNGTEYEKYGDAAKALAVFSCTWPGLPLIYSGQELPNLKRLQFFEKDAIEWKEKKELHEFYKTLLQLHTEHPALNGDSTIAPEHKLTTTSPEQILAYLRSNENKEIIVLLNLSRDTADVTINDGQVDGKFNEVFARAENDFTLNKTFNMQPWSYLVFEK